MWSKEDTITLINLFEGFPELWQKNRKFTEIELKSKKQSNIADKFNTTEAEIQRKLHNIRTQANQEWNKIIKRKSKIHF